MAVLRAKRLFVDSLAGSLEHTGLPRAEDYEPGANATTKILYTCPSGKRAILRTFTAALGGVPAGGTEPTSYLGLKIPTAAFTIDWFWHVDHKADIAYWLLTNRWNGQLVLHAGDQVYVDNFTGVALYVHGSGHELPEVSS